MAKLIEVISGAIFLDCEDGVRRILLTQRAPSTSYSWRWVTLGGKVEPGETHAQTLDRETDEECGRLARLVPDDLERRPVLYTHEMASSRGDGFVRVVCYAVRAQAGAAFAPCDGTIGVGWYRGKDLEDLDLGPADAANVRAFRALCYGAK